MSAAEWIAQAAVLAGAPGDFQVPRVPLELLHESTAQRIEAAGAAAAAAPEDARAAGDLGIILFAAGFPAAAAQCFEHAGRVDAAALAWPYFAGLSLERAQDVEGAADAYERALAIEPYAPACVRLAELLIEPDPERAEALYRRAVELDPELPEAQHGLARCARLAGDRDAAERHARRAIALAPRFAAAHYELAMLLRAAGRREDAVEHLALYECGGGGPMLGRDRIGRRLLERARGPAATVQRAEMLWRNGRAAEAETIVREALAIEPDRHSLHAGLGVAYLRLGRFEESEAQFRRLLEIDPDSVEVRGHLAEAVTAQGRLAEAERLLREALAMHPASAPNLLRLGRLHARRGERAEAIALLRRARDAQPADARTRLELGRLLAGAGRGDEAAVQLRAAVELEPDLPGARVLLADEHARRGEHAAAARVLREGLRRPVAPALAGRLAWLLATCPDESVRDGAEAVRLAEEACRLTRRSSHLLVACLAAAYAEAGRFDDAVAAQREALRLASRAGAPRALAQYQRRLGQYASGRPLRVP